MALSDNRPVRVVQRVAVAAAAQAVKDPAPRAPAAAPPALPSIWGGWASREHTVVREAEDGVVGGGRTATVWEPEFGSLFD